MPAPCFPSASLQARAVAPRPCASVPPAPRQPQAAQQQRPRLGRTHVLADRVSFRGPDSSVVVAEPPQQQQQPLEAQPPGSDPWEDEKWSKLKWTVFRGVVYDLTPYMKAHPVCGPPQ